MQAGNGTREKGRWTGVAFGWSEAEKKRAKEEKSKTKARDGEAGGGRKNGNKKNERTRSTDVGRGPRAMRCGCVDTALSCRGMRNGERRRKEGKRGAGRW